MKRGRPDANQPTIDLCAQRVGAEWITLSLLPKGGADRIYIFQGRVYIAEIKNPMRDWQFEDSELKLQAKCERQGVPYHVIETEEDFFRMIGLSHDSE